MTRRRAECARRSELRRREQQKATTALLLWSAVGILEAKTRRLIRHFRAAHVWRASRSRHRHGGRTRRRR
eukprot:30959-Pelagococcus_subviridis.AAC.14